MLLIGFAAVAAAGLCKRGVPTDGLLSWLGPSGLGRRSGLALENAELARRFGGGTGFVLRPRRRSTTSPLPLSSMDAAFLVPAAGAVRAPLGGEADWNRELLACNAPVPDRGWTGNSAPEGVWLAIPRAGEADFVLGGADDDLLCCGAGDWLWGRTPALTPDGGGAGRVTAPERTKRDIEPDLVSAFAKSKVSQAVEII